MLVAGAGAPAPEIFGIEALDSILKIDELLIELAKARLDFLEIVGETLTCVDMVSRRAPELAWTSWTDFWSEPMVAASLLTLSPDCPMSVFITVVVLSDLSGKILLA